MSTRQTRNREAGGPAQPVIQSTTFSTEATPWWKRWNLAYYFMLPLRLFLGVTFIYAGLQKLTDPQYFNPKAVGYIGKQIIGFAHGSPLQNVLIRVAVPHAMLFGALVAYGELAIGLGALLGILLRPAAFFGLLLSLIFFLTASWHVFPYFYGADIVFVFAWITLLLAGPLRSGYPTVDGWLIPHLLSRFSLETRKAPGAFTSVILGVGNTSAQDIAGTIEQSPLPAQEKNTSRQGQAGRQQMGSYYRQRQTAFQRSQENRRNFLLGLVTGGVSMLGIALASRVLHVFGGDDTAAPISPGTGETGVATTPGTTATTGGTPGSGSGNVIAQVNQVATNSAVTFTIPSNGDPGILVHLDNGKFVCYDATCTHAGCPVDYDPGSHNLVCPCHGAVFDPANNAAVVQGPAPTPLTSVPIKVDSNTGAISLQ